MKPSIIARNKRYTHQVQTLLQDLGAYTDDKLNQKPADGGWSAIQIMHHLILSEEYSMNYIRKKMGFGSDFAPNNWSARFRSFLLWASLTSPIKFKSPPAIGRENLPEFATLAETQLRWEQARKAWEDFFEQMPAELSEKLVYKHPRAGKITFMQMLWFFETHFQRHRKQIYRSI
ncbi:MAG: DinB family protein [Saprospiraceae bacterium]|nr:DinB family protein [Saprospiraceae bacterium]